MNSDRAPRRTCIGCRQARAKADLVRLVRRPDGTVVVDPRGPGRGAYVCPDERCLTQALKRGRLAQAFRQPCEAGPGLAEEVRGQWRRRSR